MILLAAGAGIALVVWAVIIAPQWVVRCRETGGHWALSGIIYLSGPLNAVIQLTYPGGTPGGFSLLLARGNTIAAWTLGIVALLSAFRNPRRGQGLLLAATLAFYGALLLSSIVGFVPAAPPEEYFVTPLLVLPFLLHGGFQWRWLVVVLRRALRAIVVLSLISVPLLPSIAYDRECCRELFGIERIQGITGHPNTLAILACFAVILELRGGKLRWLVPELAAMLIAQSTTSWVALAIGLLVIAGRLGRTTRVVAITVGLCAIVFALTDRQLVNDFFPPEFWTFTGRTTIWQAALAGFFLSPFTGYGPNLLDAQYRARYLGVFDAAGQAHNQFVQTLGGTGLIGMVCLVGVLVGLIRVASRGASATAGLSIALLVAFGARLLSETPLNPQGSTATLLLVIAVFGIASAGAAPPPDPAPDLVAPTDRARAVGVTR